MGLIMVIGIVAKNGILLLDADERFRAQGARPREAMLHAAQRRLRPIVMTALAAVCGMLPLAFALGAGSQMLQPLAIAVIGGLSSPWSSRSSSRRWSTSCSRGKRGATSRPQTSYGHGKMDLCR